MNVSPGAHRSSISSTRASFPKLRNHSGAHWKHFTRALPAFQRAPESSQRARKSFQRAQFSPKPAVPNPEQLFQPHNQIQTFKNAIPGYEAALGLSPQQTKDQENDANYYSYVLACQQLMRNASLQWTGWKDLARGGGDLPPSGAPVAPTLPASPTVVDPGIEVRFRALVKQIKGSPAYTESIGAALGSKGPRRRAPIT